MFIKHIICGQGTTLNNLDIYNASTFEHNNIDK